jgi:hypothetical protein
MLGERTKGPECTPPGTSLKGQAGRATVRETPDPPAQGVKWGTGAELQGRGGPGRKENNSWPPGLGASC